MFQKSGKKLGKRKTTTNSWYVDNEYVNGVDLTTDGNIVLNWDINGKKRGANKGIFAQGVNFNAKGQVGAYSDGNIYVQGTKDRIHEIFNSHTTKKFGGVKYGSKHDYVNSKAERYRHTQLYGEAGITLDSEGRLRVEGADVQSYGNVLLRGKQGVEILPGEEINSRYEEHTSKGIKASLSAGWNGISAGVGYQKTEDRINELTKNVISNNIQTGGDVEIRSEEGNITMGPTDGFVGGKLKLDGNDIDIIDAHSERIIDTVSKKTYIGVGVTAGIPVIGAAKQLIDAGRAIGKSKHKEDYLNSGFGAFSAGMGAVSALGGNVLSSSVSLNYNKSQNSYHREEKMSVGSRLYVKGGVEYNGKNLHTVNLNMLNEGDTVYNITGNIIKEAGKSTVKENSDGKSFGLSVSHDTFDSAGKIQNVLKPSNGTVTAGVGRGKSESQGEYYSHNQDITKGTTYYNNSPDVKVRGVDVQTGGIAGKVASLTVESVQDRTDGKSSGYNISYGIGIGEHAVMRNGRKEMADGLHTTNIGVGYSRGKHTERTTNAIGGFTAEHGVLDVIGKTVQTGSVIGGGFTLNTGTYEKNDLEDVNKRKNVGINLTFTPGVTDIYRNGKLTPDSVGGVLVGTRIDYSKDDYVAKVKATIGNSVNMTVAGKKADLSGVNRDTSKMVDVLKDRKITPVSIDLGTEYWATNYGREKTKGDFAKAGNKIERVVEIIKAVSENEGKDIGLYYRDRLDFEAERDRKERSGEIETILIDRDKALEMAERAAGRKIDDLQIISTKDPNIKEIVGADAIAGRAYHVGNGKIVIVADNIGDYAKAMGTIAEEGRHIYHRNNNGLEDSEDYASFYGRQFERYYDRNFGNNDVAFITERLKYTKEQLGNDWENDIWIAYNPLGINHVSIYDDKIDKFYSYGEPVPYASEVYKQRKKLRIDYLPFGEAKNDVLQISSLDSYLKDAKEKKQDVVMFKLNLNNKEMSKIEKRLGRVTKGFESFSCPAGKSGCSRKADYYLMIKEDLLPDMFQQYDVLDNNCTVFVKRMLFGEVGGSGLNLIHGNLPSNIADWAYNRTSTPIDRINGVTRSKEIYYYDYNHTMLKKTIIIKNKTVRDVYLQIQNLR